MLGPKVDLIASHFLRRFGRIMVPRSWTGRVAQSHQGVACEPSETAPPSCFHESCARLAAVPRTMLLYSVAGSLALLMLLPGSPVRMRDRRSPAFDFSYGGA